MKIFTDKNSNLVIDQVDECNLKNASLSNKISSANFEPEEKLFHTTLDRILFNNPVEVVTKVLQANNFIINIENILACLDQMTFAIKAKKTEKNALQSKVNVNEYQHCLLFKMPQKRHIGPLLKRFYMEIDAYETELSRLRQKESDEIDKNSKQNKKDLKTENEKLKIENQSLKAKAADLSNKILSLQKVQNNTARALESGNIMPPNIRLAVVRGVNVLERHVLLKVGRKTMHLSFDHISFLPVEGEPCLIKINEGQVEGAYFFEKKGSDFNKSVGEILASSSPQLKIRDENRVQHLINATTQKEEEKISQFKRGDKILLEKAGEHIIRFDLCKDTFNQKYQNKLQEDIALSQIDPFEIETENENMNAENSAKKEVA